MSLSLPTLGPGAAAPGLILSPPHPPRLTPPLPQTSENPVRATRPGAVDIQAWVPWAGGGRGALTELLGRACECALDHLAVGIVPSTHTTLVLLLAGADHPVAAHLLQRGGEVQCTLETPSPYLFPPQPRSGHPFLAVPDAGEGEGALEQDRPCVPTQGPAFPPHSSTCLDSVTCGGLCTA